jgi:hypothetical protein
MTTACEVSQIAFWVGCGMGALIVGVAIADAIVRWSQRGW